jgi:hypothetical protein
MYVNVLAEAIPTPGTASYAIMVHFDPNVVQMVTCSVDPNSLCQQPDDSTISISAASEESLSGDWVIAGITFRCGHEGFSPLTMTVRSWGSAIPETITPPPAIANGAITCGTTVRGVLRIGEERGTVGEEVSVDLVENTGPTRLGAWTVDMQYDPSKIEAIRCIPYEGGVCSTAYSPIMERVTGASAEGLVGEHTLVTYVFRCLTQDASPLTLSVNVFAYAGVDPQPITLDIANGLILCLDATPTPLATATLSPALPPGGSGGTTSPSPWLPFAALLGAGAIAIGAARLRRRA